MTPIPAIAVVLIAVLSASLLQRRFGAPPASGRLASIDGLRGYLAMGVFIHHASIWYFYLQGGKWQLPPSRLYAHLGPSCVALFFMITGFLFFAKLMRAGGQPIDWLKLFVSRVLRLGPLFICAMLALFLIVAVLSGWQLNEPMAQVARQCIRWLSFSLLAAPDINQVPETNIIVAGVTWSLAYEWFFYGSLPLLALLVGIVPRWPYLLLGLASVAGLILWQPKAIHLWAFGGGMVAALACKSQKICQLASGRIGGLASSAALVAALTGFPSFHGYVLLALLTLAFVLIACGNSLFGLLVLPASRMLGEMAFGIYLLHGLVLFMLFHCVLGPHQTANPHGMVMHWLSVLALTPALVLLSYGSFRFIESPAMRKTGAVTAWLRRTAVLRRLASEPAAPVTDSAVERP